MGLVIRCECGAAVHGESEIALVAAVEAHIKSVHPAADGAVTREDLLAMAFTQKEDR
jgi:hypothetical protein